MSTHRHRGVRAWPLIILCSLAGCSSPPSDDLSLEEARYLRAVLQAKPEAAEPVTVPDLVRDARQGVVFLLTWQSPTFGGYANGLWQSTVEGVTSFPDVFELLDVPLYALFGWVEQFVLIGQGTGFVIGVHDDAAYVLTNAHVVGKDPDDIWLWTLGGDDVRGSRMLDGELGELVWIDHELDAALLRVRPQAGPPSPEWVLPLGETSDDLLGQTCLTMGYPGRHEDFDAPPRYPTATLGLVSSLDVYAEERSSSAPKPRGYLQTDAAINPGNSGGPMLDMQGRVIGINRMKVAQVEVDNIGFAIPIDWVRSALLDFLRDEIRRGRRAPAAAEADEVATGEARKSRS